MTAARTIRFGIIGAGAAAETHARELAKVAGAVLNAVLARDSDKAATFAANYAIPRAFNELTAFLNEGEMDVVIITTPNGLHREYALEAARAGKHVVIEKPLEISVERAQNIIDACRMAGVGLFVIYQRVYSDAARQVAEDIAAGRLGEITLVNIVDNQFRPHRYYTRDAWRGTQALEGGGCLITQTTHLIDLVQFLLGPVHALYAATRTAYHPIETEDVAVAVLHFTSGVLGTLSSSTCAYPGQRHLLTISGTQGSIMINGEHDQIIFRSTADSGQSHTIPAGFSFVDPTDPRDYPTGGQLRQLQAIVQRLQLCEIAADGERAMLSVKVVEAMYRAAREGKMIDV